MQKTHPILTAFLILSSIVASGQGIQISDRQAKLILKDLTELDMRRKEAVLDSIEKARLTLAYNYSKIETAKALEANKEAHNQIDEHREIIVAKDKELLATKRELRKQKRIKWLGFGVAALVVVLSL